ncbi:MAG TPA: acyltransferase family protein [Streptosporangiaceae bacterium]|nr:acyltransferase family protein [Streptosporangiaceae bacterium]
MVTEQASNGAAAAGTPARRPGLDGLRALAVLAVIAFHEQLTAFPGGFLGVDVFFVLSGYLITDLLVAQWNRCDRLRLGSFWARRARRLLPALATMLVVVTAATAIIEPGQLAALRPALLAAVTYSSNWWQALQHQSYFTQFGPPPPLQHLWSLAIEEQFYLVWPLLLIVLLGCCQSSRLRTGAAWLCAGLSVLATMLIYVPGADPSRVYYGTDTHSSAILVGAALALSWPLQRLGKLTTDQARITDGLGLVGLALLGWAVGHYRGDDRALYPAGLLTAALAAGAVVLAAASPGLISWVLGLPPLRWIGVRSYGIYLWHWPVIALTTAALAQTRPGPLVWAAEAVVAIGLAAASWRWIEQPIIRDGFRVTARSRTQALTRSLRVMHRGPAGIFPAVGVLAAAAVTFTAGYGVLQAHGSSGLAQQISQGVRVSQHDLAGQPRLAGQPGVPSARPSPALASPSAVTPAATAAPAGGRPAPGPPRAALAPGRVSGAQVTAIGDSVMLASAPQLQHAMRGIAIDAQVSRQVSAGLSLVQQLAAAGMLRHVLVFALGTNGSFTAQQMYQLLRITGPDRELVLVNTYEARPWQAGDNQLIDATARRYRNVFLANWFSTIEHRTSLLWPDEVHPLPPGARLYARTVARAVRAALAGGRPGPASGGHCPARPGRCHS